MTFANHSRAARSQNPRSGALRWLPLTLLACLTACVIAEDASKNGDGPLSEGEQGANGGGSHFHPGADKKSKKSGAQGSSGAEKPWPNEDDEEGEADGGNGSAQPDATGNSTGGDSGSTGMDSSADTTMPECDSLTPVSLYLSPDDSNSMSSPSQVNERLLRGKWNELRDIPVRPWEFFNYYHFPYTAPADGLAGTLELRPASDKPGHYTLQIGVTSANWSYENRPPMNLTWVLDTSGSMSGAPMDMLKASMRAVTSKMRAGDRVSIVTWNTQQSVLLDSHVVTAAADPKVLQIVNSLESGGGTDLNAGLIKGYELARKNVVAGAINRAILVSDGGANVGVTSAELIAAQAKDNDQDGIYLAGIGVGTPSNYNDELMDTVTDLGKGASLFVGNQAEATRLLGDDLLSVLGIAARNVRVQMELPPGYDMVTFSGEEASSDPTEVEPQHLAPNDSIVFHQEIENCAPETVDPNAKIKVTVRYEDAKTREQKQMVLESTFDGLSKAPLVSLDKGKAVMAYTEALKAHRSRSGDALTKSNHALAVIEAAIVRRDDPELQEMKQALSFLVGN